MRNRIFKGCKGIADVLKATKNSGLNEIIKDIRTLPISKNETIKIIKNKEYDVDKIHKDIKSSFESKNKTIKSIKIKDYDADKILTRKTTMFDLKKINKTMRNIRKKNCDKDIILRDLDFIFYPEKDYYEPKKTVSAFNNYYIQYESIGDKDKNLSIEEYNSFNNSS